MTGPWSYGQMRHKQLSGKEHAMQVWCTNKNGYTEENLIPSVKNDRGSVILWLCFNSKGCGNLVSMVQWCHGLHEVPGDFK